MKFGPKRILCAVDLREPSKRIVEWAEAIARAYGSRIELVYADWWEAPRYFTPGQIGQLEAQAMANREILLAQLRELGRGSGTAHEIKALEGEPAAAILERAQATGTELIVMGSHGRSGFSRLRLGSVAEDVIHEASCPILVVKSPENAEAVGARNVVCPVNFTHGARQTLEAAASVAAAFQAELWVVHALESGAKTEIKREELCAWIPESVRGNCKVNEVVREGNAAEQILLFAKEKRADLIVMEADHQPFLELTTIGTTTERVMRHSPSTVLVIPIRH
jgi:nucleotide-binding universal stress UspA family protein